MDMSREILVRHYQGRAVSLNGAADDLATLEPEPVAMNSRWPAIGLLAVHAAIALADAILVATEGSRSKSENHADASRRLRDWCSAKRLEATGIKHFEWLLENKTHFSYGERPVLAERLQASKMKLDQFFVWVLRTFPDVTNLEEPFNA